MKAFIEKVAEILQVEPETIGPEFEFRGVPEWGSLMGFSILILFQDEYGKQLTPGELARIKTVGELAEVALAPAHS